MGTALRFLITDTEGGSDDVGRAVLLKERTSIMTVGDCNLYPQQRRALFREESDQRRHGYVVGVFYSDRPLADAQLGDQVLAKDISGFNAKSDAELAFESLGAVRGEIINPSMIRRVE